MKIKQTKINYYHHTIFEALDLCKCNQKQWKICSPLCKTYKPTMISNLIPKIGTTYRHQHAAPCNKLRPLGAAGTMLVYFTLCQQSKLRVKTQDVCCIGCFCQTDGHNLSWEFPKNRCASFFIGAPFIRVKWCMNRQILKFATLIYGIIGPWIYVGYCTIWVKVYEI